LGQSIDARPEGIGRKLLLQQKDGRLRRGWTRESELLRTSGRRPSNNTLSTTARPGLLLLCLTGQTLGLIRKTRQAGFGPAGGIAAAGETLATSTPAASLIQSQLSNPADPPSQQQKLSWSERHLPHILKMNESSMARKPKKVGSYKYFVPKSIGGVICKAMVDSGNLWKNVLSLDFLHQLGLTRDDLREVPGIQEVGTAKSGTGLKVLGELKTPIHL
jgi:hypothetical protein